MTKARDLASNSTGSKPTLIDAKGDLLVGTAADTAGRLVVGSNGETLVADSSATTGLRWQGDYAAGKNKIINGNFDFWQRGTSSTTNGYLPDRFNLSASGGTNTFSRQAFTAGAAPVAGYEAQFFARIATSATATYFDIFQPIEDVRTFAGQTVTFSFYAKASSSVGVLPLLRQNFGSGGSGNVDNTGSTMTFTTSWARYSFTATLGSMSGKTIGSGSYLGAFFYYTSGTATSNNIDTWGWQVEAGSVATAFQTATGTLAGELAACQRYCYRRTTGGNGYGMASISAYGSNDGYARFDLPVRMRTTPTATLSGTASHYRAYINNLVNLTSIGLAEGNLDFVIFTVGVTGNGLYGVGAAGWLASDTSSNGYIQLNAEL